MPRSDLLDELPQWHNAERLRAEFPLAVIPRIGHGVAQSHEPGLLPAMSSSSVREMLRKGVDVTSFVPAGVLEYIREYELYCSLDG